MAVKRYPAILFKGKGTDYGVSFPDFPGCIAAGSTQEEALQLAKEALELHIDGMIEAGEKIPLPSSSKEAERIYQNSRKDGARSLIFLSVDTKKETPKERHLRINITLEESCLRLADQQASARRLSRSAYIESLILNNG